MSVRVAINGFGRIGRAFFRVACAHPEIEIVAINDLVDAATLVHFLKYDSVHGGFDPLVEVIEDGFLLEGREIKVLRQPHPKNLPWAELDVDIVIESSGRYTDREHSEKHLQAGAKRVIISAPARDADLTICMGINEDQYQAEQHRIISNASCTTNCLAPVAKVMLEEFGFVKGLLNTVHCYTNGQQIHDVPQADLRRGRSAGQSMIPTTTGAAKAVTAVLPELEGKLLGMAVRVPVPNVSLIDLVVETERTVTAEEVNRAMWNAAQGTLTGILEYCEVPLVSKDFTGHPASAIVDAESTVVVGENMVRVIAWYDNEWGYSNRLVDLVQHMGSRQALIKEDGNWQEGQLKVS
ncbi:glyceraldehyde-3-phosphate dehydrogenase (NAD+) [Malonomonas rubra DSM 5091]|uniref:Glyceraldehyde-3-phosphate dehydrogenase n=1 Tax=Malonomonas rubra DSM 5091 TaxID=1122189 RepID=A0A1M6IAP6_MALRU|nr:type I glyceraldehyde-3-phosphate dehydrogenase [Malonomonas rubra]SHJ31505.1 glyceraldehyde-3-phosphate dehydrogenase (NAD+) [Malonomonas rubra DSM 5091]